MGKAAIVPMRIETLKNALRLLSINLERSSFGGKCFSYSTKIVDKPPESVLGEIEEEKSYYSDFIQTKSYLNTPNILYVRDAIYELDKKKSMEINKMWRSYKHNIKNLLINIKNWLEQPEHRRCSSPIPLAYTIAYI
jgi:hypothetical protein